MSIIRDKTSESSAPISLSDKHYVLGRDDGESLLNRIATDYIRKHGKYEKNTGPTARVIKALTSEAAWWQKLGTSIGITDRQDKVYLCELISDHTTSVSPEAESADDNVTNLQFLKFILPGDHTEASTELTPGNIVRVRIDDRSTMFAASVAGTIDQIIDTNATLEQTSGNCGTVLPGPGGTPRTNVAQCTANTPRSGRRSIKTAKNKPPRPTSGEFPKSPITGLRANTTTPPPRSTKPYEIPRIGRINSGFPTRFDGVSAHKGVDFRTTVNGQISTGAPIKAALDGTAYTDVVEGYGYVVAIKHTAYKTDTKDSTFWTFYAHLLPAGRVSGAVKAGQEIGKSGNSSGINEYKSTPHLHFEVIYDNDPSWTTAAAVIAGGAVDPINDFFFNRFEKK